MACLVLEMQADISRDESTALAYDGDATVRISNPDAENGYDQEPGPLDWLNSARLVTDPAEDSVTCVVSVGDPRGGFAFTVRRLADGRLVIHAPHPGESMAHVETSQLHEGTLLVAGNFASEEPEQPEGECERCGVEGPIYSTTGRDLCVDCV